jgi:hypothetical protein
LASWTIEASVGSTPLAVVACDGPKLLRRLPAGTMAVLSLQLALSDGPWHASGPVRVAEDGSYVPFAR